MFIHALLRSSYGCFVNKSLGVAKRMSTSSASMEDIEIGLKEVKEKILKAQEKSKTKHDVKLVAVSKTKPIEMIQKCISLGHTAFGENYVQELIEKAQKLPKEVEWHFIGHLQSNKCKSLLAEVPNLYMIHSVDSIKLAKTLDKHTAQLRKEPLNILVQVNTSGESTKSGVAPSECLTVVESIIKECSNLKFRGLMTIGDPDAPDTRDFERLVECKKEVCEKIKMEPALCELSMGMSSDFEKAIEMGSTIVRVGSSIFGARQYNK